jgi:hypothetical protein
VLGPATTTAGAERLLSEQTPDAALVDLHLRGGELSQGFDRPAVSARRPKYRVVSLSPTFARRVLTWLRCPHDCHRLRDEGAQPEVICLLQPFPSPSLPST